MTTIVRSTIMVAQLKWGRLNQGLVAQSRSISYSSDRMYSPCTVDTICQVADKDLVAVNEQVQLKALKNFYDR